MTKLSERLVSANTENLSAREIARRAQALGYTLNHDTAARYLRGDHGRPDEPTLRAWSDILTIPLSELRRAADLPADQTDPYQPPPESSRLNRRQRRAVDEVIRAMLEPTGANIVALSPSKAGKAAGPKTGARPKAARRGDSESKP